MFSVGLTGGIGSGKSMVANLFAKLKVPIIDADRIAHDITQPGTPAFNEIVTHLGSSILNSMQHLDRKKLAQQIFKDPSLRTWLEQLLHPIIIEHIKTAISTHHHPYCIVVIPLLTEVRQSLTFLDRVCVVDADIALQKQRVAQRDGISPDQIEAIFTAQATRQQRLKIADDVIENNRDLTHLEKQVKDLHQKYLELASGGLP